MIVKPKTGLKIPDPALLDYLPEDGREVESSAYWIRRLRDGDVIEVQDTKSDEDEDSQ
ncbi:DUF2635 domain-containing protein [Acinetobacter soli]|uniref:DUF2635 domain-containing protein n=1 Tax=Acinetobacter soli TaxID=487316 RepID=UPI003AA838D4